ncbi:MAG: response regulator transcription factor [Saprospiraceae bacterium]|nr:response regulator transcription factor [Saprospiraceae bacterium]
MNSVKLAIIEDDQLISQSLISYFEQKPEISLICVVSSVEAFSFQYNTMSLPIPDVLLLDIQLPGKSGIEGIPEIKKLFPNINIIMLTTFEDSDKIFKALSAGANSYLSKQSSLITIYECIHTVNSGGSFMSPGIARKVIDFFERIPKIHSPLSDRQTEIVSCIVDGMSYKMVGARLNISLDTVRTHIMQIYRSLNINSKGELIKWAIEKK